MVRWLRWHCPPDTGFEIRTLAVWGRARYLSVTEAPHNTNFHTWMGKKQFCFFQTAETGNRAPDSGVKGSGANHYPRAPALTSGMGVVLMWGHCLRHRPYIKQHMSAGRVAHRKRLRHRPPHLTETCVRVELMVSQRRRQRANIKKTFFEKLMNIQYLNLPSYPNRWMVWLIQQGLAWRPRCVKTCCQEDGSTQRVALLFNEFCLESKSFWFKCIVNTTKI